MNYRGVFEGIIIKTILYNNHFILTILYIIEWSNSLIRTLQTNSKNLYFLIIYTKACSFAKMSEAENRMSYRSLKKHVIFSAKRLALILPHKPRILLILLIDHYREICFLKWFHSFVGSIHSLDVSQKSRHRCINWLFHFHVKHGFWISNSHKVNTMFLV